MFRYFVVVLFVVAAASPSLADDYHYRNILVGEQAAGLGGAYIGISDDPSGIFYNPAGIFFSMENYFSLSGNAYVYQVKEYKNVLAGQNYRYTSAGLVPTFFGLTQNYGRSKWGFALIVPNATTIDQDDEITGISTAPAGASTLRRRLFEEDTTYLMGPSWATEVRKDMTVGISLFGLYRTRNRIDNQLILFNNGRYAVEERTMSQDTYGLYPKLGVQYMPAPRVSVGATLAKTLTLGSSRRTQMIEVDTTNTTNPEISGVTSSPNLPSPIEVGLGGAFFPTKRSLIAADFLYYTSDQSHSDFATEDTWNISVGLETYLSEAVILRLGGYTNNANTPAVKSGAVNQLDHVDLYGVSAALAFRSAGSSFTLGTVYSTGSGEGQAIGNDPTIHRIEESRLSLYITGSYQL